MLCDSGADSPNSGEEARLAQAEEETSGDQASKVGDQSHEGHDDSPANHDEGDPPGWLELLEQNVGRRLGDNVADKEYDERDVVLVTLQSKVCDEVVKLSLSDVYSVEERE